MTTAPPFALATAPFCRACGTDHAADVVSCPTCGWTTIAMPPALRGPLGDVHHVRQRLRKRPAVRIGDDGANARLLLESGEELSVALSDMPAREPSPVPWASVVRSAPGQLLEVAAAIAGGHIKLRWEPEALRSAAVAAATDQLTVRLLALDALALDMEDLLPRLGLAPTERTWLVAVRCTQRGDAARLVHQVAALPPTGYRPKLGLLLDLASAIHDDELDVSVLAPQLAPFLDTDPVASVLHRVFGLSSSDAGTGTVDARWLAAQLPAGDPVRAATDWGVAQVLDDDQLEVAADPVALALVGAQVHALAGLRHPGSAYVTPDDVHRLPDPVVDDLIEARSVNAATALATPRDEAARIYLTARLAPDRCSDDELVGLRHDDERARRTFPLVDPAELDQLTDSPLMGHFRQLALVRLKRGAEADLEAVRPEDRANVASLLAAVAAAAAGEPVIERLTGALLVDPSVWPVLAGLVGAKALEAGGDLADQFPAFCEWLTLHHAREHLFRGDWTAAVVAADRCLALATAERVRDEALNLKACGQHYLGDSAAAVASLEAAIEGAYSESLLANIGIVAAGLKPEVAAKHLGKLMVEAPNTAMRAAAGRRVVELWLVSDTASWLTSAGSSLPDVIRDPLRHLVVDDIDLDDFRLIAKLLAQNDGDWLADPGHLHASTHRGSLEARVYQARARGFEAMVEVLGEVRKAGELPDWLERERHRLREDTAEFVMQNLDDSSLSVGTLPIAMYENGALEGAYDKVLFPAMGLASLALHYSAVRSMELPDSHVMMLWALRDRWAALDADDRERVAPIVELATRRVAINRHVGRSVLLDNAISRFNDAVRALQATNDPYLVLPRIRAAQRVAVIVDEELSGWLRVVEPADVRSDLRETLSTAHELDSRCARFL